HAVPGRSGRHSAGAAAQTVTRPSGARIRAPGRRENHQSRRSAGGRYESRFVANDRRSRISQRSLLPSERVPAFTAAAARAHCRHPEAGSLFHPKVRARHEQKDRYHSRANDGSTDALRLAWKCSRVGESDRARRNSKPRDGARDPALGTALYGGESSARRAPHHSGRRRARSHHPRVGTIRRNGRRAEWSRGPPGDETYHTAIQDEKAWNCALISSANPYAQDG